MMRRSRRREPSVPGLLACCAVAPAAVDGPARVEPRGSVPVPADARRGAGCPDDVARARITLESSLPSESLSKAVDAATLSVVGSPAFAVDDEGLVDATLNEVVGKPEGRCGCKQFLRDGHQTAIEDPERLHDELEQMLRSSRISWTATTSTWRWTTPCRWSG
jgi:hypothetical protein